MKPDLSIALKQLHHRPIAFYPCYADLMGSVAGGVVLSQLLYWYAAQDGQRFYKNDREIREETRVTERELREAKRKLKSLSFLKITREGLPAITCYEVLPAALFDTLNVPTSSYTVVRTGSDDGVRTINVSAETTTESKPSPRKRGSDDYSVDFLLFWKAYPHRMNKQAAWKAWQKEGCEHIVAVILQSVDDHKKCDPYWNKDRQGGPAIPHPATYLNQRRWTDEFSISTKPPHRGTLTVL